MPRRRHVGRTIRRHGAQPGYRGPQVCVDRRHHLPAARLLGPHRPAAPVDQRGPGQRIPAPVLVHRPGPAQGHQAAARRRRFAAGRPKAIDCLRSARRRSGLGQPGHRRPAVGAGPLGRGDHRSAPGRPDRAQHRAAGRRRVRADAAITDLGLAAAPTVDRGGCRRGAGRCDCAARVASAGTGRRDRPDAATASPGADQPSGRRPG